MLTEHLETLIKAGNPEAITAEMITNDLRNEAFRKAVENGHLAIVNRLIELTPNLQQLQQMIHSRGGHAFRLAAINGHLEIVNRLIELTPDPEQQQRIIHSGGNFAFTRAAMNGHLKIVNRLIELTLDPEQQQRMIHAISDSAFENAARNGHLSIVNRLIELTSDPVQLQKMLNSNPRVRNKNTATFLAIISTNDQIFRNPEISEPLNETKISKLKELRTNLINSFGESEEATQKANSVIITLMTGETLKTANKFFTIQTLISKMNNPFSQEYASATEMLSKEVQTMHRALNLPAPDEFLKPVTFLTLSLKESDLVHQELKKLFGFKESPSNAPSTSETEASTLAAATSVQTGHHHL